MKAKDLTGEKFGRLTVLEFAGRRRTKGGESKRTWMCLCECGTKTTVDTGCLTSGATLSCGCYGKSLIGDSTRSHGLSGTPEYNSLWSAIQRCYDKTHAGYNQYGALGIKVCDQWLGEDGILEFVKDMGNRPEGTSLDRIDSSGDYCPENCRWATPSVQSFNKKMAYNNTSGRTGVYINSSGNWTARINKNCKFIHLGTFATFEEACTAREKAEIEYYGFTKE